MVSARTTHYGVRVRVFDTSRYLAHFFIDSHPRARQKFRWMLMRHYGTSYSGFPKIILTDDLASGEKYQVSWTRQERRGSPFWGAGGCIIPDRQARRRCISGCDRPNNSLNLSLGTEAKSASRTTAPNSLFSLPCKGLIGSRLTATTPSAGRSVR